MVQLMGLAVVLLGADSAEEAVHVSARLVGSSLEVGGHYEIEVGFDVSDGWSASEAGMPHAILQIEVPKAAKLDGEVLRTQGELSKNEYLQAPYELLMEENPTRVGFTLKREPEAGERFSFNVLAYVSREGEEDSWFVRRRLELDLSGQAEGVVVSAERSDWGRGRLLQLGDKASAFTLPRADGSKVSLRGFRGKKNVVVSTYRAHW